MINGFPPPSTFQTFMLIIIFPGSSILLIINQRCSTETSQSSTGFSTSYADSTMMREKEEEKEVCQFAWGLCVAVKALAVLSYYECYANALSATNAPG